MPPKDCADARTDKTPNRFVVRFDGAQVGRIFDRIPGASAPRNATWCWTIDGKHRRDSAPATFYALNLSILDFVDLLSDSTV